MKKILLTMVMMLIAASMTTVSAQDSEYVINNDSVISFLHEGMTSSDIIGLIKTADATDISYSPIFLRKLKSAGADQELTSYLADYSANAKSMASEEGSKKSTLPDFPGIFWTNTFNGRAIPLTCNTFTKEETGLSKAIKAGWDVLKNVIYVAWDSGNWSFFDTVIKVNQSAAGRALDFLGKSNFKSEKLVLTDSSAVTKMMGENSTSPEFLFRFNNTNGLQLGADNAWMSTLIGAVDNPNDFICVKLNKKKHERTMPSGISFGNWLEDSNVNFDTYKGNIVPFRTKLNDDGTYTVNFPQPLDPGEYCFFYKNFKNSKIGRIVGYDFSVH